VRDMSRELQLQLPFYAEEIQAVAVMGAVTS
jgi:hypothetical protein